MRRSARRPGAQRSSALVAWVLVLAAAAALLGAGPAQASIPRGDTVDSAPAPTWGWEQVFVDG